MTAFKTWWNYREGKEITVILSVLVIFIYLARYKDLISCLIFYVYILIALVRRHTERNVELTTIK